MSFFGGGLYTDYENLELSRADLREIKELLEIKSKKLSIAIEALKKIASANDGLWADAYGKELGDRLKMHAWDTLIKIGI